MDNCNKYIEMISSLVDGELSDEQMSELNAHLDSCQNCRRVYEAFMNISNTISDDLVEPPEKLAQGIMYKVHIADNGGTSRHFAFGRFTALAACLALILYAGVHFNLFGTDDSLAPKTDSIEMADEKSDVDIPYSELSEIPEDSSFNTSQPQVEDPTSVEENTDTEEQSDEASLENDPESVEINVDDSIGLLSLPEEELFDKDDQLIFLTEAPSLKIYEGEFLPLDQEDSKKSVDLEEVEPILNMENSDEISQFSALLSVSEKEKFVIPDGKPLYTIWFEVPTSSTSEDLSEPVFMQMLIWDTDDGLLISTNDSEVALKLTVTIDEFNAFIYPETEPSSTETSAPVQNTQSSTTDNL